MRGSLDGDGVSPCVSSGPRNKKRFPARWSLRQLIYSSPILGRRRSGQSASASGSRPSHRREGRDILDGRLSSTSKDNDRYTVEIHRATSRSTLASTAKGSNGEPSTLPTECPLCYAETTPEEFRDLAACGHRACVTCFRLYLRVEITESRVCIACPECHEPMHPNEIRSILDNPNLFEKYEDFMVRRVLAVDPDTRWCPAPDCGFAVIASECASCPKLRCERPGCDSFFCYHCKAEWHPNQTCDAARAQRSPHRHAGAAGAAAAAGGLRSSSLGFSQDSHRGGLAGDDMKPCPRCQVLIAKMDDGSCNHMMCAVCGAEFCWLCMKEINDLHFLSPSGCTFWGKKPWSRKKKILWQLGTLVGAPVGIALVAGITVPAMLIGIPVWVGKKLRARYKSANKHKRHAAMAGGVMASVLIAPILAGLAVGIGVPILLFYVYGVVPVSLCRSGGCGGGGTGASDDDDGSMGGVGTRAPSAYDASSAKATDPSIGEASLSMASGSQVLRDADRDSASTVALAGSLSQATQRLEVQADVVSAQRFSMSSLTESMNNSIAPDDGGASVRALAGSMLSYKPPDSDCCSCITTEDCTSERVHFDDNVSFIASQEEKTSIGSGCSSFRPKCSAIYIDIEEKPRKYSLQASILRSQFFHSISDGKPATKSLDDKTIIEVSNETLDKQSVPLIGENPTSVVICQLKSASTLNLESSKL